MSVDEGNRLPDRHAAGWQQLEADDVSLTVGEHYTTLADIVRDEAALHGLEDDQEPLSGAGLKAFCRGKQASLLRFGVSRGSRVCLAVGNGPTAIVALLALAERHAVVPLDAVQELAVTEEGLRRLLQAIAPVAMVLGCDDINPKRQRTVCRLCADLGVVAVLLTKDPSPTGCFSLARASSEDGVGDNREGEKVGTIESPSGAAGGGAPAASHVVSVHPLPASRSACDDIAVIMRTSGTTSAPKLVPLTHRNLCCGALCVASTLRLEPADVCLNMMPLHHLHGVLFNCLASFAAGTSVICTPGFAGGKQTLAWLESYPVTWYSAVPAIHRSLLAEAKRQISQTGEPPVHRLKFIRNCSAPLAASTAEQMQDCLRCDVMTTWVLCP